MLPCDDRELVLRISSGDTAAEEAFHYRFNAKILVFAARRRVPAQDCEDIAQEVLLSAVTQIRAGRFRGESTLATWVHQIMKGKVADFFRRRRSAQLVPLSEVAEESHAALIARRTDESVAAVNQALSRLSAEDQMLLLLHEQRRYTLEEIGRAWRLGKSTIAERLAGARERFKRVLLEGGGKPTESTRLKDQDDPKRA
jgi:RNA polymerase sigma-70 factor (ECF subfamily)